MEVPELRRAAMSNLEVHHRKLLTQSGDDSEEDLITLCVADALGRSHSNEISGGVVGERTGRLFGDFFPAGEDASLALFLSVSFFTLTRGLLASGASWEPEGL
jgi:hypothetical protein